MSESKNGPYVRCLACDAPLPDHTVLPLKASEDEEQEYHGCYEDLCSSCKAATQRAYHYSYHEWDHLFDLTQAVGPAYEG